MIAGASAAARAWPLLVTRRERLRARLERATSSARTWVRATITPAPAHADMGSTHQSAGSRTSRRRRAQSAPPGVSATGLAPAIGSPARANVSRTAPAHRVHRLPKSESLTLAAPRPFQRQVDPPTPRAASAMGNGSRFGTPGASGSGPTQTAELRSKRPMTPQLPQRSSSSTQQANGAGCGTRRPCCSALRLGGSSGLRRAGAMTRS